MTSSPTRVPDSAPCRDALELATNRRRCSTQPTNHAHAHAHASTPAAEMLVLDDVRVTGQLGVLAVASRHERQR
jgi:hypothetical protein